MLKTDGAPPEMIEEYADRLLQAANEGRFEVYVLAATTSPENYPREQGGSGDANVGMIASDANYLRGIARGE